MTCLVASEVGRGARGDASPCAEVALSSEEVGQRIVIARKEKRWSRLDLATALDVSPSSIYRWENGKLPSVHELLRLASVLDKPADYLTEPPERQTEMADLQSDLEEVGRRLLALEVAVDGAREGAFELLASIHDQLVLIRERQEQVDAQANRT